MQKSLSDSDKRVGRLVVEAGMVRAGALLALPAVLRSLGVDPPELLAEFDLTESFFEDPENTLFNPVPLIATSSHAGRSLVQARPS
jgi:hypothetical protein